MFGPRDPFQLKWFMFVGRHDEPEEQEQDRIRAEIRASHRFDSFAGQRSENTVKWCVLCRLLVQSAYDASCKGISMAMITCGRSRKCSKVLKKSSSFS